MTIVDLLQTLYWRIKVFESAGIVTLSSNEKGTLLNGGEKLVFDPINNIILVYSGGTMKLEEMTNAELKRICKDKKIPTAELRNKKQLLEALAGKGLTAVESDESPLNAGIEKEKLYLGKCPKTGEKLYK